MVLNDLSLVGQFLEDDFCEVLLHDIKPVLEKLKEKGLELHKSPELYSRMATAEKTMWDMLSVAGDSIVSMIKGLLVDIMEQEPFFEADGFGEDIYVNEIGKTISGDTCLYEAIFNRDSLLSFPKSEYSNIMFLSCNMAGKNYLLRNINNKNECLLWLLSEKKLSNYNEVFSEWEYIGKALSYKATGCFDKDMKDICGNFEEKDYMEIMGHLSDLEKVILTRTVTRFSHPLIPEDKVYEYRLNLSNGNQLRMTYKNISPIWFLTAFIKKSERTPRHERDRARKQLSECQ